MLISAFCYALSSTAQDTMIVKQSPQFTFGGFVEGYYSYDFNKPADNFRPGFLYSYNRHNEFNVNLAMLRGSYTADRMRANVAIAAGTYMNANYAAEPGVLKNIFEANAGIKLTPKANLWLDIGILPSHIGFESAIGNLNPTLTRGLAAEGSPYYEGGAKLTFTTNNDKLSLSVLALNGWQRITRIAGNSLMSWGTQVYFKPSENVALNYSTFFGTDRPDNARLFRMFHNFYGIFTFAEKFNVTAGFDIGSEDKTVNGDDKNNWYAATGILKYNIAKEWAAAVRAEYFNDENEVIIATNTPNGFKTSGLSLNIDYMPIENAALRFEVRNLTSKDRIFPDGTNYFTKSNTAVTISAAVNF